MTWFVLICYTDYSKLSRDMVTGECVLVMLINVLLVTVVVSIL